MFGIYFRVLTCLRYSFLLSLAFNTPVLYFAVGWQLWQKHYIMTCKTLTGVGLFRSTIVKFTIRCLERGLPDQILILLEWRVKCQTKYQDKRRKRLKRNLEFAKNKKAQKPSLNCKPRLTPRLNLVWMVRELKCDRLKIATKFLMETIKWTSKY